MQIAIVTGCSTGIGYATALRLAREGCRVFATVRSESSGAALLAEAGELPISLLILEVDDDTSVPRGIGSVIEAKGRVDILVNNAGVVEGADIESTPLDVFRSMMNINTWGALRCIQAVLPTMREQRSGCIVNATSIAGRVASPGQGAYAASKWAAEAISEVLAAEVAPFGIRVAVIEPGVGATSMVDKTMQLPIDFESPYFPVTFRTSRFLLAGLADAAALAMHRPQLTDDTWIEGLSAPDDDAWRASMIAWSATDIPPM